MLPNQFDASVHGTSPVLTIRLRGGLTMAAEEILNQAYRSATDQAATTIVLDFSEVELLDLSCADEIVTAPSATLGHKNRPRSNRFVNRQAPWPSCQITFKRSPRRPRKQNRCPHSGSRCNTSCTSNDKLAKPFLISVWPVTSHTRTPLGSGIMAASQSPG